MSATGAGGTWADLRPRVLSAIALAVVGIAAIFLGGFWFAGVAVAVAAVIVWEVSVICDARRPLAIATAAGAATTGLCVLPMPYAFVLILLPVVVSVGQVSRFFVQHALYCLAIVLAAYGLVDLRENFAPAWLVWLVGVVVVTDVAGYFAGRAIGGPKFWPRVSPKKTWSGTVAGWLAAAIVGGVGVAWSLAGPELIAISVAVAMASQMGDVAESALKREAGVKDSSNLLPGHGGFFDRFDGVLGAALFVLMLERLVGFPPGQA